VLNEDDPLAKLPLIPVANLADRRLLMLRDNPHFGQLLLAHAASITSDFFRSILQRTSHRCIGYVRAGLGIAPAVPCSQMVLPRD